VSNSKFINPLGNATIIGAPKITEFPILSEQEIENIAGPIQQAFDSGMDPQQPAAIPAFVLCRLIQTLRFADGQWRQLYDLVTKIAHSFGDDKIQDTFDDPEIVQGLYTHLQALEHAQMSHAKRVRMGVPQSDLEESLQSIDADPYADSIRAKKEVYPSEVPPGSEPKMTGKDLVDMLTRPAI